MSCHSYWIESLPGTWKINQQEARVSINGIAHM